MNKETLSETGVALGATVRRTKGWPAVGTGDLTFDGYEEETRGDDWPQCFVKDASGKRFKVCVYSVTDKP